ncbi:MAG: hypothetical protein MI867_12860 [Pseudomonadales bacterium]|nr:hypothetical protein [Pseudomonadales bacterium]
MPTDAPIWLALVTSIAPIVLLRAIWRKKSAYKFATIGIALALFTASVNLWAKAKGWEFGLVYAFAATSLTAWIAVALNHERKPRLRNSSSLRMNPKINAIGKQSTRTKTLPVALLKFLMAGPLSGLAACIILLALGEALPVNRVNQLVITGIGFPILWAAFSVWICSRQAFINQTLSILSASLFSVGFLLY